MLHLIKSHTQMHFTRWRRRQHRGLLLFGADTAATNQQTRVGLSSEMGWSEEENQRITNVNGRTEAGEVAHVDGDGVRSQTLSAFPRTEWWMRVCLLGKSRANVKNADREEPLYRRQIINYSLKRTQVVGLIWWRSLMRLRLIGRERESWCGVKG